MQKQKKKQYKIFMGDAHVFGVRLIRYDSIFCVLLFVYLLQLFVSFGVSNFFIVQRKKRRMYLIKHFPRRFYFCYLAESSMLTPFLTDIQ